MMMLLKKKNYTKSRKCTCTCSKTSVTISINGQKGMAQNMIDNEVAMIQKLHHPNIQINILRKTNKVTNGFKFDSKYTVL